MSKQVSGKLAEGRSGGNTSKRLRLSEGTDSGGASLALRSFPGPKRRSGNLLIAQRNALEAFVNQE